MCGRSLLRRGIVGPRRRLQIMNRSDAKMREKRTRAHSGRSHQRVSKGFFFSLHPCHWRRDPRAAAAVCVWDLLCRRACTSRALLGLLCRGYSLLRNWVAPSSEKNTTIGQLEMQLKIVSEHSSSPGRPLRCVRGGRTSKYSPPHLRCHSLTCLPLL